MMPDAGARSDVPFQGGLEEAAVDIIIFDVVLVLAWLGLAAWSYRHDR